MLTSETTVETVRTGRPVTASLFRVAQPLQRHLSWGDLVVFAGLLAFLYACISLALSAPRVLRQEALSLSSWMLPWYTTLSVARMAAAYVLSMGFTLAVGRLAAYNKRAEKVVLPTLDVLQSVPILSFLPVVLLSLSAVLPERAAAELASVILIFTSQVWNMTFAWYQSLTTIPRELDEAARTFLLLGWRRFRVLELPFGTISLLWNSMMSWAGGWFFLMAAEMFTVGQRNFRLPGLGSYLQEAANQGNTRALILGITTLVAVIVVMDQFIWRPLLAWADRFKLEMTETQQPPTSWFYDALRSSRLLAWLERHVSSPLRERLDARRLANAELKMQAAREQTGLRPAESAVWALLVAAIAYGGYRAALMLIAVPLDQWGNIGTGLLATLLRVAISLAIALAWTLPVGVLIGTNPRAAAWLQPIVQILASVPATALFPVMLLALAGMPGGLDIAAVLLMLMGTQWYLLFNIIAGAAAIPQDLKYTATLLQLNRWERWRTLILPSLFPYTITGAITAGGGAWNASIVAERVDYSGKVLQAHGIGAVIAEATARGDFPLLLASTLSMIVTVVLINRLGWRRLYRLAEDRFKME